MHFLKIGYYCIIYGVLNIIILSKCLDFLAASTSGTLGVFILTGGYRYYKVYNLGNYK